MKTLLNGSLNLLKKALGKENSAPQTFFEVDEAFIAQYELAQAKTQMEASDNLLRRQRHYSLYYLLQNVDIQKGDFAEAGCFRGLSAYQIGRYLKQKNFKGKFFLFDSFEGLSAYEKDDLPPEGIKNQDEKRRYFACPVDIVRSNLKEFGFIEYLKGWIPERFKDAADKTFSFVHIDVDLYRPIKDSLEFFYPRLAPGGVIVFDDYGCAYFPGARKAVDEFLKGKDDFFLPLPSGSAFLVKNRVYGLGDGV